MQLRRALLTSLAIAVAGTTTVAPAVTAAPAAKARPRPVTYCNLLKDDAGDSGGGTYSFIESDALDILSADLATGKTQLVAVLRLKSSNYSSDTWDDYFGYSWNFGASLNGIDYDFKYSQPTMLQGGGPSASVVVGNTRPKFDFKIEGNNLVWRVDRKELPSLNKKPGQKFTAFSAASYSSGSKDTASEPGAVYPDKGLSCLKPR